MGNEDMREFLDERTNGMGDPLTEESVILELARADGI